jgi:polysaccharide export outer membrane protein
MAFFIAFVACQCLKAAETDPTVLKLKELASTSSLNLNKGAAPAPNQLLDNSIDQDKYYIGGGDVFAVHIVELPSVEYFVVIDQNCDGVISDLGVIRLGKKTLSQAKTILCDFIRSKMKKPYEVYVSLVRVKTAIITVSGAISHPGTFQMEGTNRLFDVILMSNNHILPPVSEFDYREVKCIQQDSSASYDLLKFLFLNDNSQNPYIYPGDNICINLSKRRVFISGSLRNLYLGFLPVKTNETVKDFLSLFNFDCSADSTKILVTKYSPNNVARTIVFSLNNPENIKLDDRDAILVPPKSDYPQLQIVDVQGEINRPGNYPIQSQKTDAMTIIEQAGGPTDRGNLKRAFIIRRTKVNALERALVPPNNNQLSTPSIQRQTSPVVRSEIAAALANVTASKDYSIIPLKGNAKDIILEADDQLIIPKKENVVYVSGNVRMPGAYPFVEGNDFSYYIHQAGGLSSKGDKSNIFTMIQYGETYQIKESSTIEEGDVIVVPESQQYKFLTTVLLPIVSTVLTALQVVILVYSVTK